MSRDRGAQPAVWLPVPGWPWHEANLHTMQVRSIDRWVVDTLGRRRYRPGQILKPIANDGRDRVNLGHGPRRQTLAIARIVNAAMAAADQQGA